MFCYQCEETARGTGCDRAGVCGKKAPTSDLQDLLLHQLKVISWYGGKARELDIDTAELDEFVMENLFVTITNGNFDDGAIRDRIIASYGIKDRIRADFLKTYNDKVGHFDGPFPPHAEISPEDPSEMAALAEKVGILSTENEDIRSLRSIILFGIKGMAAYAHHAAVLDASDPEIFSFMEEALAATLDDSLGVNDLVGLALKCGEYGVRTMALLSEANTGRYGHPEVTKVNIGVGDNPGILISGHDLKDLEELLEQTKGTGVDIYTHGEMLPANYYPAFKKYSNLVGNYGGSWWKQKEEFESFNGPVLLTTNCLVPPRESYVDRVYTTGITGFTGVKHIPGRPLGGHKDFSKIIQHAKKCPAPIGIEKGEITGGFGHKTVLGVADKVLEAIGAGQIKRFFVMAGCDGRQSERNYYTRFAEALPKDTIILTAGCAKYRYNKLGLGDIGGIPRVLDAGQCNDSYSLVLVAKALAEAVDVTDINDLPISYNIAWYEQKAVLVLLALLHLGVKNIRLGPKLPAFVSPNVLNVLVENFNIAPNTDVESDIKAMMAGN